MRAPGSILPLLLTVGVAPGRFLTFSGPQCPGLFSGARSASLLGLWGAFDELICGSPGQAL